MRMRRGRSARASALTRALATAELSSKAAMLDFARKTAGEWMRQGVPYVTPLEVLDLLNGGGNGTMAGRPGADPPQAVQAHPRDAERDPVTGCLPVTAPQTGPEKVQAAIKAARGGEAPRGPVGYA
jgi:hypothetical protein